MKGDRLRPAGRAVQNGEQVGVAARRSWKRPHQVNMKVAELLSWVDDVLGWRRMQCHFSPLAMSLHQAATWEAKQGHTKQLAMSCLVTLMQYGPGCEWH